VKPFGIAIDALKYFVGRILARKFLERKIMSLAQSPDNPTPPPLKGWRLFLIKVLKGTINLLNSALDLLENPSAGEENLTRTYSQALVKVRSFLPAQVNEKLPDWGLSGAIALLAVIIFSTTTSLLFPSAKPVEIPRPVAILPNPEPLVAPDIPPVVLPKVPPVVTPPSPALPETPVATTPDIIAEPTPEVTPSPIPELVPEPLPEPVPEATPSLTPEQVLIASIQEQVTEIIPKEAGLITAIKPNFPGSLLKIIVSQNWYDLSPEKQDQVAAKVEERSQDLDFRQLLITDATGHLVARKAVVGRGMIILRRLLA
jgi:hypothetical protein